MTETHIDDVDDALEALVEEIDANVQGENVDVDAEMDSIPEDVPITDPNTTTNTSSVIEVKEDTIANVENPLTALYQDKTTRFEGAIWFKEVQKQEISIIGAGGIGSWTALAIGRLNPAKLQIWDSDSVEEVNLAGQLFHWSSMGYKKVYAVHNVVRTFCKDFWIETNPYKFTSRSYTNAITIGALDNMEARKSVFIAWKNTWSGHPEALFIDGRLSADELQIFAFNGENTKAMAEYEYKWLFNQSEGEHTQCSFKQTSYMAMMIGAMITNLVVNHCANLADESAMYDIPFYTNYMAIMTYHKTENI